MAEPADMTLYEKVKKSVYKKYPKHSAYRSGLLVKEYKDQFNDKYGARKQPYKGKKKDNEGLSRWFKEEWKTEQGKETYKEGGSVFRPTKRITKDTPTTFKELSKKEIKESIKEKKSTGRVSKFKKSN